MRIGTGARSARELAENTEKELGHRLEELYAEHPEMRPKEDGDGTKALEGAEKQGLMPPCDTTTPTPPL